MDLVEFSETN